MMNDDVYSRALRAHFLAQAALSALLFKHFNSTEGDAKETDTDHLRAVYEGINLCVHISQMSRTAKLWIEYYQQVSDALVPSC